MRCFLLLAALGLLFGVATAAPLPADTIRIDRLPATGLLLQRGWRYHAGDDLAWSRPDFDDRGWDTLTAARTGQPLPARVLAGSGWFRLRLRLGDSLLQQALGLQTEPVLAGFEVYSNGRRIGRYGTYSPDPVRVRTGSLPPPPLDLRPTTTGELVLAVRYAPRPPIPGLRGYLAHSRLRNLGLRLRELPQIRKEEAERPVQMLFMPGRPASSYYWACCTWFFTATIALSPPIATLLSTRWVRPVRLCSPRTGLLLP